jgi:hypothetical protein
MSSGLQATGANGRQQKSQEVAASEHILAPGTSAINGSAESAAAAPAATKLQNLFGSMSF